jgi:hypothetical protein
MGLDCFSRKIIHYRRKLLLDATVSRREILIEQCGAKNKKIGCSRRCECRTRPCEVGVLPDILKADLAMEALLTQEGYAMWERQDAELKSKALMAGESYKKSESLESLKDYEDKDYEDSVREYLDHGSRSIGPIGMRTKHFPPAWSLRLSKEPRSL